MSYLPNNKPGLYPYWLLVTVIASTYNVIQCYNPKLVWQSKEVYAVKAHEMTPLAARCFGTWSLTSSLIRIAAAYNISEPIFFYLQIGTFSIAALHFTLEMFVFKTVRINRASIGAFIVAFSSLFWSAMQRGYYLS